MEEFLSAVDRHLWTLIGVGFLIYVAVVGIIRAAREKDED